MPPAPLQEVRTSLVGIIDSGAAGPAPGDEDLPVVQRFSHACLAKLYALCSRGNGPDAAVGRRFGGGGGQWA